MKTIKTANGRSIEIALDKSLYNKNEAIASINRRLLEEHGIKAVDILGSIGSGKTTITGCMAEILGKKKAVAALAGDITTTIDADRIREKGAEVLQINTDGGCHLDANMVKNALPMFDLEQLDILLIENVGNLICPGGYPVGAQQRMVVVSTTEGPYMIVKHPYIFKDASVVAINKIDLAAAMEVDLAQLKADALTIKPDIRVVFTNGRTGEGISELIAALGLTD
ncbi:hydrogenase nickel incorporation protein HypB [bacterium]|nr:hydrogenase nickel incorporation protein HypB [bacterium]